MRAGLINEANRHPRRATNSFFNPRRIQVAPMTTSAQYRLPSPGKEVLIQRVSTGVEIPPSTSHDGLKPPTSRRIFGAAKPTRSAPKEVNYVNWYRIKTSLIGLKRLATLPPEDKQACVDAYKFFQRMQAGEPTETADETKAVADYYKVLNNMLSIFDLEKLYIPPQLDENQGLYGNQTLVRAGDLQRTRIKGTARFAPTRYGLRTRTDLPPFRHSIRRAGLRI